MTEGMDEAGRQVNAEMSSEGRTTVTVTLQVLWQTRLRYVLDTAKKLRDDGHHAAAIVTAQTACEVCTELVFIAALRAKGVEPLTKPLDDLLSSYNLANSKVRNLYVALSGDRIQDQPFWSDFKGHAKLRHDIVHGGESASLQDADRSIAAVEKVINHLLQNRP